MSRPGCSAPGGGRAAATQCALRFARASPRALQWTVMAPLSVSLILLAAVVHAVWNILAKGIRGNGTLFVWWYGLVSSVVLIPVSLLEPGAWQSWGWPLVGAAVVSGLLHTVYGTALQLSLIHI